MKRRTLQIIIAIPTVLLGAFVIRFAYTHLDLKRGAGFIPRVVLQCHAGECPNDIYASSIGKTYTYLPSTYITVFLDQKTYPPKEDLKCLPEGVIGDAPKPPHTPVALYVKRFETLAPGQCTLESGDFHMKIQVEAK
jgi:hypothetical protein